MPNNYDDNDIINRNYPDDNRYPRERTALKPLLIGTSVVALLVFATLAWYGYSKVAVTKNENGVPVVEADTSMSKAKPTDPGGMDIPHQDTLVYNRMDKNAKADNAEQLLPAPEQPVDVNKQVSSLAPQDVKDADADTVPTNLANTETPAAAAPSPAAPETIATNPTPVAPAPAAPAVEKTEPAPTPAKTVVAEKPAPVDANAAFNVQLAAVKEQDKASSEWKKMQSKNSDVLGALNPQYVKADVGDKGTFFRVQAGPMTRDAASQLCDKLKSRQQPCMVVKSK